MKKELSKIILLLILIVTPNLFAGENDTNDLFEIQCVTEKREGIREPITTKINFVNIQTNTVLNSIDLVKDNPFSHLPFKKELILYNGIQRYSYHGLKLSDVYDDFKWMYTPLYEQNKDKFIPEAKTWAFYDIHDNLVTILFSISFFRTDEEMLGKKSFISIYDSKGNEIFKHDNVNEGISGICTTSDGNYFAYTYGRQLYAYERMFVEDPGIKIYNTKTGEMILKKNYPFGEELGYLSARNNIFLISTFIRDENNKSVTIMNYINPGKKVIYSGSPPIETRNRIKNYSEKGLILGKSSSRDKETELYEFEKNFQKEVF